MPMPFENGSSSRNPFIEGNDQSEFDISGTIIQYLVLLLLCSELLCSHPMKDFDVSILSLNRSEEADMVVYSYANTTWIRRNVLLRSFRSWETRRVRRKFVARLRFSLVSIVNIVAVIIMYEYELLVS